MSRRPASVLVFNLTVVALLLMQAGLIVWASMERGVMPALQEMASDRWGLATLADLGIGLIFAMAWMACVERRRWVLPLWYGAMLCLGFPVVLVYLLIRGWSAQSVTQIMSPSPPG
jgi:hypothetical protein